MMNGRRTTAFATLFLMTTVIAPSMLFADDTDEEALRRDFVSPENRAEKFRQSEAYFPHRVAMPGDKVLQLPKSKLADDFEVHYAWEGQWHSIDDFNERTGTNALLILKDGKIVKEIYRNGATPESRFISWSIGKSIISTLVGMAIEDGYIDDVNDLLTKYIPELIGSAYDGVTIRNALQMTSGVEWDEATYSFSDLSKPLNRGWEYSIIKHQQRFVDGANELPRANVPGKKFNYSTMDSSILGWLVEKATQQRVTNYLEKRLWQPAGMEFKASWVIDGPEDIGREMGGGMLAASLRDFGRFGLMMSNRGKLNGVQHVSKKWVRAATTPDRKVGGYGKIYEGYPLGYGYQWWLFPSGKFEAQGIYGQFIYVAPKDDVVIIKLSYWPQPWIVPLEIEAYAFFNAVIDAL
jgi:CubicO group peptidase (beta-lactamase class C family)